MEIRGCDEDHVASTNTRLCIPIIACALKSTAAKLIRGKIWGQDARQDAGIRGIVGAPRHPDPSPAVAELV